jgi:hypothetical protein
METVNRTKTYYKWAFSNELAAASFSTGTLLLILFKSSTHGLVLLKIGFYHLLFSILINSIMLLYLIFLCIILPEKRKNLAFKIFILLCNIPIAIFYYNIIF